MASFHFTDSEGNSWMILPGLPADFPDTGGVETPFDGLTFRSSTGEIRVLPSTSIPRHGSVDIPVAPHGTASRVRDVDPGDWEELLRHAIVWPPST